MPTTALIAGGLGAAGSIGGALIGANASQSAAAQQVAAQQAALKQEQALYTQGLGVQSGYVGQAQNTLAPIISAGQSVLPTLQGLLTPGTSAATLSQMPGFGFASQYGTMAATNALASKTGASAGPLAAAVSQYNNGLASNQYQNVVGNLQAFAGLGANASTSLSGIFGNAGNAALGASTAQSGLQSNTIGNVGNAQATGTLGSANALTGGINGATGGISNSLLLGAIGGNGLSGGNGLYTPQQIANIGNMPANSITDAQSNAYGIANGLT